MLASPASNAEDSDDRFHKWVVALAAFRNQPACLQYLFSAGVMDAGKFAQAALDAINQQKNPRYKTDHLQKQLARREAQLASSQARVAKLENALKASGIPLPPLDVGQEFLLPLPEEKRRRLEWARVFSYRSAN